MAQFFAPSPRPRARGVATANAQGELSPLEIGMHALHYVERAQGKKGGGLDGYAAMIGKKRPNIVAYRDAAEVASYINIRGEELLSKANHLAAIHKLPEEAWGVAVEAMIAARLRPYYEAQAKGGLKLSEGRGVKGVQKVAQVKSRDEAGKAAG